MAPNSLPDRGNELFRLLVERVTDYAILALDAGGHVATWNAGAERMYGWTAEEIIGRPYRVFFPPEAIAAGTPQRVLREAVERRHTEDQGWRVRKDGARFWADATLTALFGDDGELLGYAMVTRDLTEQKRQEAQEHAHAVERIERQLAGEALAAAERRSREERALRQATAALSRAFTVGEMLPQVAESALAATDADGAVVERLDGDGSRLEVVAAAGTLRLPVGGTVPYAGSYAEYVVTRGEPARLERLASAERGMPPQWAETCPDCSALVLPLPDAGTVVGALLLLRAPVRPSFGDNDLERARVFADLASLAVRKVYLLDESERRRQELEQVMESRARLMRGFSHDVKNPLGAALGFIELLAAGDVGTPTAEQRPALDRAALAIRSAVRLIDDLVELARVETGGLEIALEPVNVRDAVEELVGQYAPAADQKHLRISTDYPALLPIIRTDSQRVRQIIGNLLSNAVKYTPERGSIAVSIRERASRREGDAAGNGPWLALHVVDSGPGIAPEDQERIFAEFTRLAPTAAEGAGLGLSISRRLARLLGGDLTVESEPGHGANFTLWLPLLPIEARSNRSRGR